MWKSVDQFKAGDYIAIPAYEGISKTRYINVLDYKDVIFSSQLISEFKLVEENKIYPISKWSHNNLQRGTNGEAMEVNVSRNGSVINKSWVIDADFANLVGIWIGDGHIIKGRQRSNKQIIRGIGFYCT
jgi:hypothetical protein